MTGRRVVVTGMGVVAPNGIGLADFDAALRAGRSGLRHVPKLAELGFGCTVAGVPEGADAIAEAYFDADLLLAMNANHRYGSIAAVDAWTDAGFPRPDPADEHVHWEAGAVIGTGVGGLDTVGERLGAGGDGRAIDLHGVLIGRIRAGDGPGHRLFEESIGAAGSQGHSRGQVMRIGRAEVDRAACPHFGAWPERGLAAGSWCGGCQWQHIAYPAQAAAKRQSLIDALVRIGKLPSPEVAETVTTAAEYGYRNKIELTAAPDGARSLGFLKAHSNELLSIDACLLLPKRAARMPRSLAGAFRFLSTRGAEGILRAAVRVSSTAEVAVDVWTQPGPFPRAAAGRSSSSRRSSCPRASTASSCR